MANSLPESIVMRSSATMRNLRFSTEPASQRGFVTAHEENVFEPFAKIIVERAKADSRFIHLRFSHTNKYWARASRDRNNSWILANSNQPEEDTSKLSCTMFEPITRVTNIVVFLFRHVQSGGVVRVSSLNLFVEDATVPANLTNQVFFTFMDWDTLVRLPRHVAFKGFNDRYIQHVGSRGVNSNYFSSEDPNSERSVYEIIHHPDGHIRVRSNIVGRFWRLDLHRIVSDSTDGADINTLFWPVKVGDNAIALRNAGNNRFCSIPIALMSNLTSVVNTITREARLTVEELVLDRSIINVRFRMEDARIYDEQASIAGIGCPINESEKAANLTVTIGYEDTSSFTFSNSLSLSAGVAATFRTGIPFIVEGEISVSAEISTSLEWNRTTEETRKAKAAFEVVVPPKSRVRVHFISTRGTCSVPFSYTQRDKSSTNGNYITTNHTDGIFTGVNYYSFHFEKHAIEPL